MIKVLLPAHLRVLAKTGSEVSLEVREPTIAGVLDALENEFPALRGTLRDYATGQRRAFVRFFLCEEDWSHLPLETALPDAVASGKEPFLVVGAIAGG